ATYQQRLEDAGMKVSGYGKVDQGIKIIEIESQPWIVACQYHPEFKSITSRFGMRTQPVYGTKKLHTGTDFGAPAGTPIPSQTGGTVSFAGWGGGYGNLVRVKQGIWEMYYAHMSKILAKKGQKVTPGTKLGLVGSTGTSTAPHI